MLYVVLIGWYWIIPYIFISQRVVPTNIELFIAVCLHTLGVVTRLYKNPKMSEHSTAYDLVCFSRPVRPAISSFRIDCPL